MTTDQVSIEELAARIKKNPFSYPMAQREPEDPDIKRLRETDPAGYARLLELWKQRRVAVNAGQLPGAPTTSEGKEEAFRLAAELFREVKADLEQDPP